MGRTDSTPRLLEPSRPGEVADMLREASGRRLTVIPRGSGTRQHWGTPASSADIVLSLAGLSEPIEHCAGDLTVTAPAGATLQNVNAQLSQEGQWLPLDPWAGGRSTIGGLLATNDSGPRRLRYGAPRDLVIGIEFALADGRRAKAGGRVVKNVAGYDLGRLLCGSYGALAVITGATFKLSPLPPASRTVVVTGLDLRALGVLAQATAAAPITPTAAEISAPDPRLLVRFETTPSAADQQAAHVVRLAAQHGAASTVLDGAAEADAWLAHETGMRQTAGTLLKLGVLPSEVATLVMLAEREAGSAIRWRAAGRATLGVLLIHLDGPAPAVATLAATLRRAARARDGHLAILSAPPDVTALTPRWDDLGPAAHVMRAVKSQFDPYGTLCPLVEPGGLS